MQDAQAWKEAVETAAAMGALNIGGMPWAGGPDGKPGILMTSEEAAVLTELAGYAFRRGYQRPQALQEIASRHPHPFEKFPHSVATCKHCGRSEIFSIHRNQDGGSSK